MIGEIKKKIESLKGKKIKVWVDVGRNKSETYEGFVLDTYKNIWTFKTETDIKSFSYSDILINSVVLSS
ncbi:protein veg [Clostridium sp. CAG:594]|nr:protein veg [Clostridium sp. CAG:594]